MQESESTIISFKSFWFHRSPQVFNYYMDTKQYKKAAEIARSMVEQKYYFASACLYDSLIELQTQENDPEELIKISNQILELVKITL